MLSTALRCNFCSETLLILSKLGTGASNFGNLRREFQTLTKIAY